MDKNMDKKIHNCKFHFPMFAGSGVDHRCIKNGLKKSEGTDEKKCESCGDYKSKYIEYPIEVTNIENKPIDTSGLGAKCGDLCRIRPCGEEYGDKTYIGIYIGDLPIGITSSYNSKTGVLTNGTMTNPAIFVPELKKIIYGCESWWGKITKLEDADDISDKDINGQWYMQMLKALGPSDEKYGLMKKIADYMIGNKTARDAYLEFETPEVTDDTKEAIMSVIMEELSEETEEFLKGYAGNI